MIEQDMAAKTWAMGDAFSLADCSAAPPLFYVNKVMPFDDTQTEYAAVSGSADGARVLRARA